MPTISFNLFQVVLISGLINALILFLSLRRMAPRYRRPARFLGLFIVGYLLYHVDLWVMPDVQRTVSFIIPHLPLLYFLPALLFFFVTSVFHPGEELYPRYRWMLAPGLLDIIYAIGSWAYVTRVQSGTLYEILTGPIGFFAYEGGALVFSAVVLGMLAYRFSRLENVRTETFRFFRWILAGLGVILLRWALFIAIDLGFPDFDTYTLQVPFWIFEAGFLIYIGYKVLRAPQVLRAESGGYEAPDPDTLAQEAKRLRRIVEDERLFLQPDLDRQQLAEAAGRSEVHISSVLNEGLESGFYEFINGMRVKEAERLIRDNKLQSLTVEALAREVGFRSKSTFYKAFREQTGLTPTQYRAKHG